MSRLIARKMDTRIRAWVSYSWVRKCKACLTLKLLMARIVCKYQSSRTLNQLAVAQMRFTDRNLQIHLFPENEGGNPLLTTDGPPASEKLL